MTDEPKTIEISGGEAIARMIRALGAAPIFGMGGFQLLPFYDAARRLGLAHYLINDERSGAFMADAYARMTGAVGLVDATLGPGATNLVTGLVEALNAGIPMVAIVGDTHQAYSWKNMTQEARQREILRPAVKDVIEIRLPERIPELMSRAFDVATSGRPGPVVVDVPEDVSHAYREFPESAFDVPGPRRIPARRTRPSDADLEIAARLISQARRPLILAGGGVHLSDPNGWLTDFARDHAIPVAHTLSGKGAIPCSDPLSAGLFGRYDRIANKLIADADVLLVIGCKLGEIATKRYALGFGRAKLIHIDITDDEFGRNADPDVALLGDARETIAALHSLLEEHAESERADRAAYTSEVASAAHSWQDESAPRMLSDEIPISMLRLVHELNNVLPDDGVLVADGGFAAHWSGLLYDTKRAGRSFVANRGFASIGYGLPGAIGAALACPNRVVVGLTGDAGFNMSMGELETAKRLGVSPTIVIVNNAASGYVKALQHAMYGVGSYVASDLSEVNYANVAVALGCRGIRVSDPGELQGALLAATHSDVLSVVDVVVTRDPSKMLPAIDSRTVQIKAGDRIA